MDLILGLSKIFNKKNALGLVFTICSIAVLSYLLVGGTEADNTSQSLYIDNSRPTVNSITISTSSLGSSVDPLILTENSDITVYIHGSVTDENSCQEINDADGSNSTWKVAFYRTDFTNGSNCVATDGSCYHVTELDSDITGCTGADDLDVNYEMNFTIPHFADATDNGSSPDYSTTTWKAYVGIIDDNGTVGYSTATTDIATLTALNVASSVDYGQIALNGTSGEKTIAISNTGNDNDLDPTIEQSAVWSCTQGEIPIAKLKWNTETPELYANGTSITNASVDLNDMSIAKQTTDEGTSSENVYLMLQIPLSGVGGVCTSTLTFTAA